jgi:LacI family transcriptional regulator
VNLVVNRKQVTLRSIADNLGLSLHTVSKALRGRPGMSEETRTLILKKAEELGYRTKEQLRGLAVEQIPIYRSKPRRFNFIVPPLGQFHLHTQLMEGLAGRLAQFGHHLTLVHAPAPNWTEQIYTDWLEDSGVSYSEGVFLPPMLDVRTEERICSLPLPKILLNFPPPAAEVDSIIWDTATAVHQSVRYLTSLGHRRILYIGNIEQHRGFRLRFQAFREAMAVHGLNAEPEQHLTAAGLTRKQYSSRLRALLNSATPPTALLVGLEQDLAWVYETCREAGVPIPAQCSLIGLEHVPHPFLPDLTHPILLVRETGVRGADRMLWRIANPALPYEHIRLQGGFQPGGTVAAPPE